MIGTLNKMNPQHANQNQAGGSQNQHNWDNIPLAQLVGMLRGQNAPNQNQDAEGQNQNAPNQNQGAGDQNQPQGDNVTLANLVALIQALNAQNAQQNPQPPQQPVNQYQVVEQFKKLKPPTFNGRDGPAALEEWMGSMEDILRLLMCTDAQKVSCASFQLKEDARIWWNSYQAMRPAAELDALTWVEFKRIVMEKYYPPSYQVRMETEFFNLKQGDISVEEYERKFSKMCRFAPHLVDTEAKKVKRFRYGLRSEIRNVISGQGITTLAETFERAEEIAASFAMDAPKIEGSRGKRKWEETGREENENHIREAPRGYADRPTCKSCGKKHNGECLLGQNRCYRCKESGHSVAYCPKGQNVRDRKGPNSGNGGNARVFVMGQQNKGI